MAELSVGSTDRAAAVDAPAATTALPAVAEGVCPNCRLPVPARFCGDCGQARLADDDLTLRGFARRAVEEVLDVDSRLARSLRTLFTRPGRLSRDFVEGRRQQFGPFKLYLLSCVLFFFVALPATLRWSGSWNSMASSPVMQRAAARNGVSTDELVRRVSDGFRRNAELGMKVASVPLLSLVLAGVYRRRRRRFAEHLVFALHYATFHHLLSVVAAGAAVAVVWVGGPGTPYLAPYVSILVLLPYAYLATREFYGPRRVLGGAAVLVAAEAAILISINVASILFALSIAR